MQKNKLTPILEELYAWNPSLRNKEAELVKLIKAMLKNKPETNFDSEFAEALKKDLLSHQILLDSDDGLRESKFTFNFMKPNQKIFVGFGSLAVLGLLALIIVPNFIGSSYQDESLIVKKNPGAFGSLATLSGAGSENKDLAAASGQGELLAAVPTVQTAERGIASANDSSVTSVSAVAFGAGGGSDLVASKMILPMYSFEYIYRGDSLDLSEESGTVYRRLKGGAGFSSSLDNVIKDKSFGPLNLKSFSNLETNSISLTENKKLGLSLTVDFKEENIYIGENWMYWQSERDKCGSDQACWDSYRLKISDIPADDLMIAMAGKFLTDRGINLSNYGDPTVDNEWRTNYENSQDKENYYIPEYVSVIYPLKVDNQIVYNQSGGLEGLRVTINLLHTAVSGVSSLSSNRYEASDYTFETDGERIISVAEKGGYGGFSYYSGEEKKTMVELGTPTKSLVKFWRYTNGNSEELLVPALVFPVINNPENYYGSKFITVPLVKEMINEANSTTSPGWGGGVMPMVR